MSSFADIHNVGLPWVPLLLEEGYVATGCAPRHMATFVCAFVRYSHARCL